METSVIKSNIEEIKQRIADAAVVSGRSCDEITLVVVSKYRPIEEIREVIDSGIKNIGENRVQDAMEKKPALVGDYTFRMIGHLQRNKVADVIKTFDAIDSIDSIRLAVKVSEEAEKAGVVVPVLVQVNSSGEESKFGFSPGEMVEAVDRISDLPALDIRGIMTIGPLSSDENEIEKSFDMTREIFEKIREGRSGFETLSMGMTDDFELAIKKGSNMVRIGRAIFEAR
ncbi:MAG TPA: YggS family pyridoxal phosphate-dependent enzyme [bacterium]|nr:YggS family pyridoxal phosphate-dependent enzyme [bacterium]